MPRINAFGINRFCRTIRIPLSVFLLFLFWSGPLNLIAVENPNPQDAQLPAGLASDLAAGDSLQDGPWSSKLYLPIIFKNYDPALYALVPNVQGLTQDKAELAIQTAELTVGTIHQSTSTVEAGRVISQDPAAGLYVTKWTAVDLWVSLGPEAIPPDPSTVAPAIDPTVATTVASATEFLYTGTNPIQTGVAPETIEARRAAVLRGKVLDRDGNPLPAVTITILNHPEFGQTLSRLDGMFDMAVNGGGYLSVK